MIYLITAPARMWSGACFARFFANKGQFRFGQFK